MLHCENLFNCATRSHHASACIVEIATKFSQLFLWKIIKIVGYKMSYLRLKCTNFNFGCGSAPDPTRRAYSYS